MTDRITADYRARDGTEHDVLVLSTPAGRWRILDTPAATRSCTSRR